MVNNINLTLQDIVILTILIVSVVLSVRKMILKKELKETIDPIISSTSTIITFFIMLLYYEQVDAFTLNILEKLSNKFFTTSPYIHIGLIAIIFSLLKICLDILLKLLNNHLTKDLFKKVKEKKFILFNLSLVFGFIRGMVLIILICIPITLFNSINEGNFRISFFDNYKFYQKVETFVSSKKIRVISHGIIEDVSNTNKIIYYNGVTIEEGIKSNDLIDEKAKEITKRCKDDKEKALKIYKWVGSNIVYDDDKAIKVVEDSRKVESGAIIAFKERKGICFDYSCLFTAMAKSQGIKTRLITGMAYNGDEYVSHAWNEVYIEGRWINVDCTFYQAGNYFDNENFEEDHIKEEIAGEF